MIGKQDLTISGLFQHSHIFSCVTKALLPMLLIFAFEDVRDPEIFIWTLHVCPGTVQIVDNKLWNDRQI